MSTFSLITKAKFWINIRGRRKEALDELPMRLKLCDKEGKKDYTECIDFWSKRYLGGGKFSPDFFKIYDRLNSISGNRLPLYYYIPDDFWYSAVDLFLADSNSAVVFDDKNMYDLYFHDVPMPKTVARKYNGLFMDGKYRVISKQQVLDACQSYENVIVKPAINSSGGKGILFWSKDNGINVLEEFLDNSGDFVIQEILKQHKELSDIYPYSLNTVRIMVMIHEGEVIPLSSVLRMGVGSSCVDNYCNGGIVCGIKPDGKLRHFAINKKSEVFYKHPNGTEFNGVEIPCYQEAVEMVKYLAPRFVGCSKLQSWDIAINEDGKPILIECNLSFGGFCLHQMCNGPIFGERTEEMLDYIFKTNPYLKK